MQHSTSRIRTRWLLGKSRNKPLRSLTWTNHFSKPRRVSSPKSQSLFAELSYTQSTQISEASRSHCGPLLTGIKLRLCYATSKAVHPIQTFYAFDALSMRRQEYQTHVPSPALFMSWPKEVKRIHLLQVYYVELWMVPVAMDMCFFPT